MDNSEKPTVVFAAGGTAGHIEPAMNVADSLKKIDPTVNIIGIGGEKGMEARLVPQRGFKFLDIPVVALPRKIGKNIVTFPFSLLNSIFKTKKLLKQNKVKVVVGFGGYVSLPAYIAAKMFLSKKNRIKVLVHEANSQLGIANRVGKIFADKFFSASPLGYGEIVGIPIRESIKEVDFANKTEILKKLGLPVDRPVSLVFGGSQGAQSLNKVIWDNLDYLLAAEISIIHVYGNKNKLPQGMTNKSNYVAVPFQNDMSEFYTVADLILARSGMMTVAEIAYLGIPVIFIPLPHGNGEQNTNAKALLESGQALQFPDKDLNKSWLEKVLLPTIKDKNLLFSMRKTDFSDKDKNDAGKLIAKTIVNLL